MKRISAFIAILLMSIASYAQETWFCSTPGKVLTYANKNAEGKTNDFYKYYIKGSSSEDGKTTITFNVVIESIKGVAQQPVDCNVWTAEGYFHTNARAMMGQYGPGLAVKGHGPIIPEEPQVGVRLKDCSITIASLGTTGQYTNIRFTGEEEIETPAGVFKCWVLEYDYVSEVNLIMKIKQTGSCKMWMKKGLGVVKNVLYGKKGKTVLTQELINVE